MASKKQLLCIHHFPRKQVLCFTVFTISKCLVSTVFTGSKCFVLTGSSCFVSSEHSANFQRIFFFSEHSVRFFFSARTQQAFSELSARFFFQRALSKRHPFRCHFIFRHAVRDTLFVRLFFHLGGHPFVLDFFLSGRKPFALEFFFLTSQHICFLQGERHPFR